MVKFPIRIARNGYRGADPKKNRKAYDENQIAADLEKKINDLLLKQADPIHTYLYYDLADITGYTPEIVKKLCFSIDCGSSGFTAWRHDMTYQQAIAELKAGEKKPV
jgi:hypothetical protein